MPTRNPTAIAKFSRDEMLLVRPARRPVEPRPISWRWVASHDFGDRLSDFLSCSGDAVLDGMPADFASDFSSHRWIP